jgi:soluble lytic murein transglycosylase
MQLMPDTAEWIAGQIGDKSYSLENLHEPDRNIRYGTWYLAELQREFKGNDVLALAAYNAGRGNVRGWMEDYGWNDDFSDVQAIPYKETRAYVKQVLSLQGKYRKLYAAE